MQFFETSALQIILDIFYPPHDNLEGFLIRISKFWNICKCQMGSTSLAAATPSILFVNWIGGSLGFTFMIKMAECPLRLPDLGHSAIFYSTVFVCSQRKNSCFRAFSNGFIDYSAFFIYRSAGSSPEYGRTRRITSSLIPSQRNASST